MRDRLLIFFTEKGTLVEPDAIDHILSQDNPMDYAERVFSNMNDDMFMVTVEDVLKIESVIKDVAEEYRTKQLTEEVSIPTQRKESAAKAKDFDSDIKIKKDITGNSTCEGKIDDFLKYFNHRFETLGSMIRGRREMRGCIEISKAKRKTAEMRFICIVNSARDTRGGHRIIEVEDGGDVASVLVPNTAIGGANIVPDEVVGIIGKPGKNDLIIADRIIRPDIAGKRGFDGCEDPISVAFVADIHVGSAAFMQDKWEKFMKWLNNGDEISSSIKYMIVPGDAVDGIGIYPRQDEELSIHDIYEQYEALAGLLEDVPDYIKIIISPGNHDAVRPAEPQPALPENIRRIFPSDVVFVGNPSTVLLHGVEVLMYHGKGIDDFISTVSRYNGERPINVRSPGCDQLDIRFPCFQSQVAILDSLNQTFGKPVEIPWREGEPVAPVFHPLPVARDIGNHWENTAGHCLEQGNRGAVRKTGRNIDIRLAQEAGKLCLRQLSEEPDPVRQAAFVPESLQPVSGAALACYLYLEIDLAAFQNHPSTQERFDIINRLQSPGRDDPQLRVLAMGLQECVFIRRIEQAWVDTHRHLQNAAAFHTQALQSPAQVFSIAGHQPGGTKSEPGAQAVEAAFFGI